VLAVIGVFHRWWLHCTGGGCVTPVVVVELPVVSLGQTYTQVISMDSDVSISLTLLTSKFTFGLGWMTR
jgi:hypothetical protein